MGCWMYLDSYWYTCGKHCSNIDVPVIGHYQQIILANWYMCRPQIYSKFTLNISLIWEHEVWSANVRFFLIWISIRDNWGSTWRAACASLSNESLLAPKICNQAFWHINWIPPFPSLFLCTPSTELWWCKKEKNLKRLKCSVILFVKLSYRWNPWYPKMFIQSIFNRRFFHLFIHTMLSTSPEFCQLIGGLMNT